VTQETRVARSHIELHAGPHAPQEARTWLRRTAVPGAVLDDALLVLSELVTNSLRHAGGGASDRIEIDVRSWAGGVRIEVRDAGPGISARLIEPPDPEQKGGRGLFLIQELAERWGAERGDGSLVWVELRVRDRDRS
jgi:serine/threonine-protein kinase RsbW